MSFMTPFQDFDFLFIYACGGEVNLKKIIIVFRIEVLIFDKYSV